MRSLARIISWEPLGGARFPERFEAEFVCETKRGTEDILRIDDVFGNHTRAPGAEAVLAKFRPNAVRSLNSDAVGTLERATLDLSAVRDLKTAVGSAMPSY